MTQHARMALTSVSLFALCVSASAFAQDNTEDLTLDTITVTATKRAEDIRDVAASLTALDDETLDVFTAAGDDIKFLSARVPSLTIESSFGRIFPRAYIRGLGNTDFDLNASQPVSFIYDEVVYENPVLKGFPVFDLERVEVLRGPQGTLFGRNTPAGIIKFDSVKPSEDFDAYAEATYASFDTIRLEGAVGGRIADGWSYRVSALYQERDDYIKNQVLGSAGDAGGYDEFAYRAQIMYSPDDSMSWLLNVHGRNLDGGQVSFQANALETGRQGFRSGFDREQNFADAAANSTLDAETFGVTSRFEYDFGETSLAYIFGYETVDVFSRGDVDGGFGAAFLGAGNFGPGFIPFPAETADGIDDHKQFTHEVRLFNSEPGAFDWTLGLYVFDENLDISSYSYDTLANGVQNGFATQTQDTSALAVFGNVSFDVSDRVNVAAGLRWSDDDKKFTAERLVSPFGAGPLGPLNVKVGDGQLSWDLTATFEANSDVNLYGRIARGFRSPSIQGRVLFGNAITTADSEVLDSFEVGMKSLLLDGRAKLDLAAYTYTIDNQQLTAIGGAGNFNQLLNADKGKGYGFEMDASVLLTEDLTVTTGLSYNHTEIDDPGLTAGVCGAPCTVLDPIDTTTGGALIDGNPFPQAPEWIGNVVVDYRRPVGQGEVFASTDWAYRGDANVFLYESTEFTAEGWWEGGARFGYSQGPWEGSVFVRNMTDQLGLVSAIDFNNLTGIANEPRVYGVKFGWKN